MAIYTLPDLDYDYGALEPHISGEIMRLHHDKHHKAYVDGANTALEKLSEARAKGDFATIGKLEKDLAFKKRRAAAAEAEEKATADRATADARQRECSDARAQLVAMQDGQRVTRFAENGERVVLDDSEHEAEIERLRGYLARNCK